MRSSKHIKSEVIIPLELDVFLDAKMGFRGYPLPGWGDRLSRTG